MRRTAHKVPESVRDAVFARDRGCRAARPIALFAVAECRGATTEAAERAVSELLRAGRCWGEHHPHHLWLQGQGGPDEPWNLIELCAHHHRWVHAYILHARVLGLLARSHDRIYDDDGRCIVPQPD